MTCKTSGQDRPQLDIGLSCKPCSASVSRQSKQSKVAAAPKTRFMLAEVERKRLTDLAIKQQSQREGDTERNGKANNFRSNEDFLERVR